MTIELHDREVPSNDHVWDELDQLLAQVRAFQLRAAQRREKLLQAAAEMAEVQEKCTRMVTELTGLDGRKAKAS